MQDTAAQRLNMVEAQIRTNDVRDARIRTAMLEIPRERFVPAAKAAVAYMEACLEVAPGRQLPDPRCLAKLMQLAAVEATDAVLDVGCAGGYSTAVLARLAKSVVGLETDGELAGRASEQLRLLEVGNAKIVTGPLAAGCPGEGPFDVVFVGGAVDIHPGTLLGQLKEGGRLVCVRPQGAAGHAVLYLMHDGALSERMAFDAQVPVLPGFERPPVFRF